MEETTTTTALSPIDMMLVANALQGRSSGGFWANRGMDSRRGRSLSQRFPGFGQLGFGNVNTGALDKRRM